jgi:hypothetical protein
MARSRLFLLFDPVEQAAAQRSLTPRPQLMRACCDRLVRERIAVRLPNTYND